ncbi:MAG: hypothetical protein R3A80_13090 [Bdellovibrionota bacterium]
MIFKHGTYLPLILLLNLNSLHSKNAIELANVHVVEIVPLDPKNYTTSSELKQIRHAIELAKVAYFEKNKLCKVVINENIKQGSEEELFATVKDIALKNKNPILIGLSRSTFARIAAKAAAGTKLKGISIGASTTDLQSLNSNFVSLASPQTNQWESLLEKIQSITSCTHKTTLGIFNTQNHLSLRFKDNFLKSGYSQTQETSIWNPNTLSKHIKNVKCIFIALNFSESQQYLEAILKSKWRGNIFGVGDWNIFSDEMITLVKKTQYLGLNIFVPTGWTSKINNISTMFAKKMFSEHGTHPSPIGAYSYDAMTIALDAACNGSDIKASNISKINKLGLLRHYESIAKSGNFISKMFIKELKSKESSKD